MIARGTYADPEQIQKNSTEQFNVQGSWKVEMHDLKIVVFSCQLQGVEVYSQKYFCDGSVVDPTGTCPTPAGTAGELWNGQFSFDVPAIAPPFEYDVHIRAYNAEDTKTAAVYFDLESKFRIP